MSTNADPTLASLDPSEAAVNAAYQAMVSAIWTVHNDTTVGETGVLAIREALRAAYAIDHAVLLDRGFRHDR